MTNTVRCGVDPVSSALSAGKQQNMQYGVLELKYPVQDAYLSYWQEAFLEQPAP